MSAWTCRSFDGEAAVKIVPPRPRIPWWKGLGADSEEKREPVSDIDTAAADSLKVLDPKRPIREADIHLLILRIFIWQETRIAEMYGSREQKAQHCHLCRKVWSKLL